MNSVTQNINVQIAELTSKREARSEEIEKKNMKKKRKEAVEERFLPCVQKNRSTKTDDNCTDIILDISCVTYLTIFISPPPPR